MPVADLIIKDSEQRSAISILDILL